MIDGTCNLCNKSFTVCTLCERAQGQYTTNETMIRHCRNYHQAWLHGSGVLKPRAKRKNTNSAFAQSHGTGKRTKTGMVHEPVFENDPNHMTEEGHGMDTIHLPVGELDSENDQTQMTDEVPGMDVIHDVDQDVPTSTTAEVEVTPVFYPHEIGTGIRHNSAAFFFNESQRQGGGWNTWLECPNLVLIIWRVNLTQEK